LQGLEKMPTHAGHRVGYYFVKSIIYLSYMTTNPIQDLRRELTKIIVEQIKPMREQLDSLLNLEAEKLCPFKLGEVITLGNGKKGQINEIHYHSLEVNYSKEKEPYYEFLPNTKIDELEYLYAYQLDQDEFTITWEISGMYMIQHNSVPGKIRFYGINPANHIVDKDNKSVSVKNLNQLIGDSSDLFTFENLS
jgi:hypothetical protein